MLRFFFVLIAVTNTSILSIAQNYKLVKDINTVPFTSNVGKISNMITIDSTTYFYADNYSYGRALWKTKGESATTLLHKDLLEGPQSEFSVYDKVVLTAFNDTIFAHSRNRSFIYKIAKNGESVKTDNEAFYGESVVYNGALYYPDFDAIRKYENGKFTVLKNGLSRASFCECGGILYMSTYTETYGKELWKTDGTEEGTVLVKDLVPARRSADPYKLTCGPDNKLYFWSYLTAYINKVYLWSSDGTDEGTKPLQFLADYSYTDELGKIAGIVAFKDSIFFNVDTEKYLYKTDGTPEGTTRANPYTNNYASIRSIIGVINNKLILSGAIGMTSGVLAYDNGKFTILMPYEWNNIRYKLSAVINNKLVFPINTANTGEELWITDGTSAGTHLLKDINPGPNGSNIQSIYSANGMIYLSADNGTTGLELWKTDGTTIGTQLVKDIGAGTESAGSYLADYPNFGGVSYTARSFQNELYFNAFFPDNKVKLYKATAKPLSVKEVENQATRITGSVADSLLFYTLGHFEYRTGNLIIDSLMKYNGTKAVKISQPWDDYSVGQSILFSANEIDYLAQSGLFRFNTTNNTFNKLAGINGGRFLTKYKNAYYYSGYNNDEYDLYRTNLNGLTTERLTFYSVKPEYLTVYKDTLYFAGNPIYPVDPELNHRGMFLKTSGGSSFQKAATNFVTGGPFIHFKDKLFMPGYRRTHCEECFSNYGLYMYDDKKGLQTVYTFSYSKTSTYTHVTNLIVMNDILFFTVSSEAHGNELWRTDGTTAGTYMVKDIYAGVTSSNPALFNIYNNRLYFIADDGINGNELWSTDGTFNGTVRLTSITPGKEDPQFSYPTIRKGRIFFFANDMVHGSELWMYDINLCESLKTGNWNDASVWSCGAVPSVINDVRINAPHKIELNPPMGKQSISGIEVQKGAVFNDTGILLSKP